MSFGCYFEDGKSMVEGPNGQLIKKFDPEEQVKTFASLSEECEYKNGKVVCLDVRLAGENMLRQVQLATVRMLAAFDTICRKHDIKYWMWRGALLGVSRHSGFIPWDNELDIGIMKADYQKFRSFSHELPSDIFLQNGTSDTAFGTAKHTILAKLRDKGGCFGYCLRTGCKFHDGMMIDIFGFEEKGEDHISETTSNKVHFKVPKSQIFPLTEMKFEGFNVYVPNNHDIILRNTYGKDYNKIPPKKFRCPPEGLIGIPWFSCSDIDRFSEPQKKQYLKMSRVSTLKFISWYL